MEITCRVYRPRRPRESPLFRLVEQHLEDLLRLRPRRFARTHGPLRPVVKRVLREFLKCGLLEHGFARLWCSQCRRSVDREACQRQPPDPAPVLNGGSSPP